MRAADSPPDRPLSSDEARTWARIEGSLTDDLIGRRWRLAAALRTERTAVMGLVVAGVGAFVATMSMLSAVTVALIGTALSLIGLLLAATVLIWGSVLPARRRRKVLSELDPTPPKRSRLRGLVAPIIGRRQR